MSKIRKWLQDMDAWTRDLASQLVGRPAAIPVRVERPQDGNVYRRRSARRR